MSHTSTLHGQVAILTGAGGGVGQALALALAQAGATVVACGRDTARLAALREAGGARIEPHALDVRDAAAVRTCAEAARQRHGAIDILVNNAGVMYLAPMADAEADDWLEMVDVNLKGPLALMAAVLPGMLARGRGHIVNVSSICARRGGPGVTVYGASKAALDHVSEGLRQEVAARGVKVTSFQLGAVDTPLNDKIRNAPMRRLIKARAGAYHALAPADVAQAIVHALALPAPVHLAQAFLLPADQAG